MSSNSSSIAYSPESDSSSFNFSWESPTIQQVPQTPSSSPQTFVSSGVQGLQPESNDLHPEAISPVFIDFLAQQYTLNERQIGNLRAVYQLTVSLGGLSVADGSVRILSLALQYDSENRISSAITSLSTSAIQGPAVTGSGLQGVFQELQIRLEDTFQFTKEQTTIVRKLAQELINSPTRTSFKRLSLDVEAKLRAKPETYRMGNVFKQPARETALLSLIKRTTSGVRNSFRQDIRDSIMPGTACSLESFTLAILQKYRTASLSERISNGYLIYHALLRRFAYENKHLLWVDDNEETNSGTAQAGQKRKRTMARKGGRIANGEDFWARVDAWFSDEIAKRDKELSGPLWKSYVEETIRRDNQTFNPPESGPSVASTSTTMIPDNVALQTPGPSTFTIDETDNVHTATNQPASSIFLNAIRGT